MKIRADISKKHSFHSAGISFQLIQLSFSILFDGIDNEKCVTSVCKYFRSKNNHTNFRKKQKNGPLDNSSMIIYAQISFK